MVRSSPYHYTGPIRQGKRFNHSAGDLVMGAQLDRQATRHAVLPIGLPSSRTGQYPKLAPGIIPADVRSRRG